MTASTCSKCWSAPCICGQQFASLTTDHLLLLMNSLSELLLQRQVPILVGVGTQPIDAYLCEKNIGRSYADHASLLTLLAEREMRLADPYLRYLSEHDLAISAYRDLQGSKAVPYRAAFGLILYVNSLAFTEVFLQHFAFRVLERFTCLFDNSALRTLLEPSAEHRVFMRNLYTATSQCTTILKEQLATVSDEWILAWSILLRLEAFFLGDLNTKFQSIKEITELIAGDMKLVASNVLFAPEDTVDAINQLKRYDQFELEDNDLLELLFDPDLVKPPYFGMLRSH